MYLYILKKYFNFFYYAKNVINKKIKNNVKIKKLKNIFYFFIIKNNKLLKIHPFLKFIHF